MKVDLTASIKNFDGTDIVADDTKKPVTYLDVLGQILINSKQEDTAEIKSKLFQVCTKMYAGKAKEIDFTAEQIALIIERVGHFGTPLVVGRVKELLDPQGE